MDLRRPRLSLTQFHLKRTVVVTLIGWAGKTLIGEVTGQEVVVVVEQVFGVDGPVPSAGVR